MEKYKRTDISPVQNENERDEKYKASNPQIDSSKTKDNYHTIRRKGKYIEYINKRLQELNIRKSRKDAVLMASFVIGSDREFFSSLSLDEQKKFFYQCTRYFANKYVKENIISAVIHNDETTPHLHLNLIPIKDERLCCKDLFNRQNLRELQTDFYEQVGKSYGLLRGKEGSQEKHLSTAEFKAKKIVEQAEEKAENITATAKGELLAIEVAVTQSAKHFDDTMEQIKTAKEEREKAINERNVEVDYNNLLKDAKQGKIPFSKGSIKNQLIALTAENKRLEGENQRLAKDNTMLFKEVEKNKTDTHKLGLATRALMKIQECEPEAFAKTFFRATSIFEPFTSMIEPTKGLGRNRLKEIEEEIQQEKLKAKGQKNQEQKH